MSRPCPSPRVGDSGRGHPCMLLTDRMRGTVAENAEEDATRVADRAVRGSFPRSSVESTESWRACSVDTGSVIHVVASAVVLRAWAATRADATRFEGVYEGSYEGMVVPDGMPVPGGTVTPPTPADPFRDDPEAGSPQARQYRLWNMPQPVQYRASRQAAGRVTATSGSTPRTITVRRAEPLRSQSRMPVPVNAKPIRSVIRTASGDSSELDIPANPLRD